MAEAGLRTKNQAEYQRRYRFADAVGDSIENVLALSECDACGARFPRYGYTPIRFCIGRGSSVAFMRHLRRCPECASPSETKGEDA